MEHEEWRQLPGSTIHQVSDLGRVRSIRRRGYFMHSPSARPSGHQVVNISGTTEFVHRLVLLAFVGACPEGLVTLHMNHTPGDNRLANIRYGTRSENVRMDFAAGTRSHAGAKAPNAKLTEPEVIAIRASTKSVKELASIHGVTTHTIRAVASFKTWTEVQNVVGPFTGQHPKPTGEIIMATKALKTISAADKKAQIADLKLALKNHNDNLKAVTATAKESGKALAAAHKEFTVTGKRIDVALVVAKKEADADFAGVVKAADAMNKKNAAAYAAATKVHDAAATKYDKAVAAGAVGTDKLNAKLAALEALPVTGKATAVTPTAPVVAAAPVAKPKAKKVAAPELETEAA